MKSTHKPKAGDFLEPDGWAMGERLRDDDGYRDGSFPGCAFRVRTAGGDLAINVEPAGSDRFVSGPGPAFRCRCRVEFVGDGEPSAFAGGWLYHG